MNTFLAALVASGITFSVENFSTDGAILRAMLKITNQGREHYSSVYFECTFLDEGMKPITNAPTAVYELSPGETAYKEAKTPHDPRVKNVTCRMDKAFQF